MSGCLPPARDGVTELRRFWPSLWCSLGVEPARGLKWAQATDLQPMLATDYLTRDNIGVPADLDRRQRGYPVPLLTTARIPIACLLIIRPIRFRQELRDAQDANAGPSQLRDYRGVLK